MGIAWVGPVLVYSVLLGVAALLVFIAFRRKGLLPPDACLCGYSTEGNDTGICPECGQPLGESLERVESRRVLIAVRRVIFLTIGIILLAVPSVAVVSQVVEARTYADCRTVLTPDDGSYSGAEITWRVERPNPGKSARVDVALASKAGVVSRRAFSPKRGPGEVRDEVIAWVSSLGVDPTASGGATVRELGEAVEAATTGLEVLLSGGNGSAHVLLAGGSVATYEQRRWPIALAVFVWVVVLVVGWRLVIRRAMGRDSSARHRSKPLEPVTPAD
jgi:hypothetical protein